MIVEAAKPDAMQYSVQYELLRSQVIGTVGERDAGKHSRPDARYWFCPAAERGHARMAQDSGICAARFACSANSGFSRTLHCLRLCRDPVPRGSGCPPCCAMRSPCFWRVWFSRLALLLANHRKESHR